MAEEIKPKEESEDWMQRKWRPAMGWMYMCVCICDFILFPILFTVVQFWEVAIQNDAFRQWSPITLSNGGLFHLAMGAVLGISAWSRGQEKIAGVAINQQPQMTQQPQQYQSSYMPTEYRPQPMQRTTVQMTETTIGYNGKLAPPQYEHPII